jgi:hypothetical protein
MTEENKAKLMQAYRAAIAAGQDGIADMLEDVILGEMEDRPKKVQRKANAPYRTTPVTETVELNVAKLPPDAMKELLGLYEEKS